MSLTQIGWLAAIYPASWGILQLFTGHLSDIYERKWFIVWGMWIQAIGIAITAISTQFLAFALGGLFLGIGTAMVYPTLLAIIAGLVADYFGLHIAIWSIAAITFISGLIVVIRQSETLGRSK